MQLTGARTQKGFPGHSQPPVPRGPLDTAGGRQPLADGGSPTLNTLSHELIFSTQVF